MTRGCASRRSAEVRSLTSRQGYNGRSETASTVDEMVKVWLASGWEIRCDSFASRRSLRGRQPSVYAVATYPLRICLLMSALEQSLYRLGQDKNAPECTDQCVRIARVPDGRLSRSRAAFRFSREPPLKLHPWSCDTWMLMHDILYA